MMLPRVLVIDDQYARDDSEREVFLRRLNAVEEGRQTREVSNPVAEVLFCSGQRHTKEKVENDYHIIKKSVITGWSDEVQHWSLVMLDVRFDSGAISDGGLPAGQAEDDHFGEVVRQHLKQDFPDLPVVMLSSKRQQELRERGTPYLSKDGLDVQAFKYCLLRYGQLSIEQTRNLLELANDVVATSGHALASYREAFVHARGDVSILILGETGTGKEILAKYVYERSGRKGAFVAVNVAAIPKDLLESELFGIERGTATGVDRRAGKFEQANGGMLFLDEIGDMPLDAQAKVLRALQEREVYRVGGRESVTLDVRLVCATSRNLSEMIEKGAFRNDLYYRINTVQLDLPPLRERPEDILSLVDVFLTKAMVSSGKVGVELSPEVIEILDSYEFPGNVRELENVVERLASSAGNHQVISRDAVFQALKGHMVTPFKHQKWANTVNKGSEVRSPGSMMEAITLQNLSEVLARIDIDKEDPSLSAAKPALEQAYKNLMQRLAGAALERCRDPVSGKFNRQRAMQLLSGDAELKGKGPARVINEVLGRKQEHRVTEEDLGFLVEVWKKNEKGIY